ncbi:2-succinyl-6-hydroxy-2,4-cyclohexadiene-1-carboxylate synthase [Rossellomorea marisflavi]|uniref:2-succinyl-6-hydroxy-2, 4-cyclohexadiene-1-carboxylate synthase n=1 Tax=Rossellomorea TaxID=2837508 RepID=UPI00064E8113|nr:2-succinyl-6-hydroxy-2,4-cyclohexadiene-1-carboxylate synthase [Rossellomorea marisflavi]KML35190.1 esterase [Rossellomorea marisflavi]MCM2604681.1 2-succinyl-6-hydroxy-2,4-cyclohexadiene-1-carboxylate synthase [Rossellomorea marisflavi]USK91186.1 2-succinyl-6-hydroxy-2,4-cyclohexadiene-1-carboxylate synthase [Rossellomorea marisflavi]
MKVNEIDYFVNIKGEGPPVVFLHGFTGDTSSWNEVVDRLTHRFTCISIDLIGHGRTDAPEDAERYQMAHAVEDVEAILARCGIGEATFVGYSMGGRVALQLAITRPHLVSHLILESASPGLLTEEERDARRVKDEALAERILEHGMEEFVNFWEEIPLFETQKRLPATVQAEIRQGRLGQRPIGLANSLRGMGTGAQPSWWDHLSAMEIPVDLLVGELDEKFVGIAKRMKERNPRFTITSFSGYGHAIHVEEPQKFGTMIEDLLHKGGNTNGF